jgi:hypothetical protein
MAERDLVSQIAAYMQLQYPKAIYRFDLAADLKLTIGQAVRNKRIHPYRGYPDCFIARAVHNHDEQKLFNGLFLELKKEGITIYKKDGTFRNDEHLLEQAQFLEKLRKEGYIAEFVIGFDQAKGVIDWYMKGANGDLQFARNAAAEVRYTNVKTGEMF